VILHLLLLPNIICLNRFHAGVLVAIVSDFLRQIFDFLHQYLDGLAALMDQPAQKGRNGAVSEIS